MDYPEPELPLDPPDEWWDEHYGTELTRKKREPPDDDPVWPD